MIFADSSFYIAIAISTDPHHSKASEFATIVKNQVCTSEDVLKETLTIVSQRLGKAQSIEFYDTLLPTTEIIPVTQNRYDIGLDLFLNPKLQKDISLIDCTTAAICNELKIKRILTFDPHFKSLNLTPLP